MAPPRKPKMVMPLAEFREIRKSYRKYAPALLKIQSVGDGGQGALIPFEFNDVQELYQQVVEHIESQGRLIRLIVLKARRQGMTTMTTGRFYHKTTNAADKYSVMMAQDPDAVDFIFKMVKRYYNNLPEGLQPSTILNNKTLLEFNVSKEEREKGKRGLDGAIRVAAAGRENFGSSMLIHFLLLSELAKYPAHIAKNLLTSLLQCVPDERGTEVIMESTAYGTGGEFYDRFWGARHRYEVYLDETGKAVFKVTINDTADKDNEYSSLFVPWFAFKKYEREPGADFKRTDDEEELAERFNLNDRKLAWRRWAIANKCDGNLNTFHQEYPSTAREAFLFSGVSAFDNDKISKLKDAAPAPKARYSIIPGLGQFYADEKGDFLVWKEPGCNGSYIVTGDVAEGLANGDFSSSSVIEMVSGEQVAHWHGKISPDDFAYLLAAIGYRYNTAWVVPERNNNGHTTITTLVKLIRYKRLYVAADKIVDGQQSKQYGFYTGSTNKQAMVNNMIKEINEDTHGINCAETFDEMLTFVKHMPEGRYGAIESPTIFDDRVMDIMIGKYIRRFGNLPMASFNAGPDTVMGIKQARRGGSLNKPRGKWRGTCTD